LFRQALEEGLPLKWAMMAAGHSPKVARQGRAKLCSDLLLDFEDWEREQKEFEQKVRNAQTNLLLAQIAGLPLRGERLALWLIVQAEVARLKRRDRSWGRRNPTIVICDAEGHECVLRPKSRWSWENRPDRGDE
jgi:hypothetical protein